MLSGTRTISADRERIEYEHFILALGTDPKPLPHTRLDKDVVITNREAFYINDIPGSLAVIGGVVIGVEVIKYSLV